MALARDSRWIGRYQVGQRIGLAVVCIGPRGPTQPDSVPVVRILSPGRTGRGFPVPVEATDRDTPGLFRGTFVPGPNDGPGSYVALFTYLVGGLPVAALTTFEVVPGGHPSGAICSQIAVSQPDAIALIAHTGSGQILVGRGPYLDDGTR